MNPTKQAKQCVITGAAGGIGRALAHRFAQAGYAITGIDVSQEQASRTQAELVRTGAGAAFIIANLADPTDIAQTSETLVNGPQLDIVIHNAGINAVRPFGSGSIEEQQQVIDVNLLAPMQLTAPLLQHDKIASGGSLVFISSLSHFAGYPGAAVYAASKDGLASYARSLSVSLAGRPVHVLTVFPGPTRTAHARRHSPDNRRENRRMLPETLANQIYRAVQRRQRILVPGFGNKIFAALGKYFPWITEFAMQKTILDKLDQD